MIPSRAKIDHEYHIVELWKHSQDCIDWCTERFGKEGDRWFYVPSISSCRIFFHNQQDHLMFVLKWYNENN
jgi:hypothetical protein